MSNEMAYPTTYLQIEPVWSYSGSQINGAKIVRMTQKPPGSNQLGGTVLVAITVGVPLSVFAPLHTDVVLLAEELTVTAMATNPSPEPD